MSEALRTQSVTEEEMELNSQPWEITDDSAAEWAMKKIAEAQSDTERWKAYYAAQLEKIRSANEIRIQIMEDKLRAYFDSVPHHVTKTAEKYSLPSGELVLKKQEPDWIHDDEALLAWCKNNDMNDYVKVKETLAWADLKKNLQISGGSVVEKETGEILDAVSVVAREAKFTVTIKK